MNEDKRFIEETFPVKEVSAESVHEKNIRRGHISTLHIWWARLPLASSRATNYAALVEPPKDIKEWSQKRDLIVSLSKWENSLNDLVVKKAQKEILEANDGVPPKILDPFGGGGTIPLEALRLGCETYSSDLNPVSVLIQKCMLEYPQKWSRPTEEVNGTMDSGEASKNPLLADVRKYGNWVLSESKKEMERFYPEEADSSIPIGYIWARTIPCQNPSCGMDIPLMKQFWLSKKDKKKVALYPYVENGGIEFTIVGGDYGRMPDNFDPSAGTVSKSVAVCLGCGGTVEAKLTRQLFQEKKAEERLVAIVVHKPGSSDKCYRVATETDLAIFRSAEVFLTEKREQLMILWGIDPVPQEPLPPKKSHRAVGSQLPLYNFKNWGDLFNARQKLSLITFVDKVRMAYQKMVEEGFSSEYAKAVVSYLALILSRHSSYNATLCWWEPLGERSFNVFGRQALPMVYDYSEQNPYGILTGNWSSQSDITLKIISHLSSTLFPHNATVNQSSATAIPYSNEFFDAVFTDPPYYDNVPYSYLSDFFYVWLKRTLGDIYPEYFSTPLTPKKNEIVAYSHGAGGLKEGKRFFEESLKLSFEEIYRVLKPKGVAVIVYAHKSTEGWETLINSLLDSGLIVTGAWPLRTQLGTRLNAKETASLASSIYIIARKVERQSTCFYNEVKVEMTKYLNAKLRRLWEEGLSGADFFIAAIGSAIEVFGKYEKVMDFEGEVIRADRLLDDVREIATDYAVKQILHNGFAGEISDLTRFYVLWRWEYGEARVPFDEARKLAQSCGVDLAQEWNGKGFIVKEKQFIRILGPQMRILDELSDVDELIDVLHHVLLLWEKSQRDEMLFVLLNSGLGDSEAFYRVAQAISETLPIESKEKKLLDGFLAGRERVREDIIIRESVRQERLF